MEIDRQLVEAWLQRARRAGLAGESGLAARALASSEAQALLYPGSLKETDGAVFLLLKLPGASPDGPAFARNRALGIFGSDGWLSRFRGTAVNLAGGTGVGEGLIGPEFYGALERHLETYWQALERHIGRHLDTLGVKKLD